MQHSVYCLNMVSLETSDFLHNAIMHQTVTKVRVECNLTTRYAKTLERVTYLESRGSKFY